MLRMPIALLLASALVGVGCGPQWPSHTTTVADRGFLAKTKQVSTVDILPMHLELWTGDGYDGNPEEMRSGAETRIMNTALSTLAERNYAVSSVIEWDGTTSGNFVALAKADLIATITALEHYGSTVEEHPGELPIPYLPARLGESTHSDATLFVGGWSYVGAPQEGTGSKIAKGVAIGLVVVAAVVIIAVALEALGGKNHGSKDHGSNHDSHVRDHRSAVGNADGGGVGADSSEAFSSRGPSAGSRGIHFAGDAAVTVLDAFGRSAEIAAQTDWGHDEALPHDGDSQMYLEMTLVDNRTGLTLWHAHQRFPADSTHGEDVDRVAHALLASLPAR